MEQKRIDVMLVERGLAPSRENAKRLIESGRVTVNAEPFPGVLLTEIVPSDSSRIRCTRARPRPLPSVACEVSP